MSKCVICGRFLDASWKTKCHDCWKKTEFPKKDIKKLLKKYGSEKVNGR